MSYYRVLNRISGNLVDLSNAPFPAERFEGGLVQDFIDEDIPDLRYYEWSPSSLAFVKNSIRALSKIEFLTRFTMQERIAARSSVDPIIKDMLSLIDLAEFINLDDPNTQQAVGYLAMVGILTNERATEILT
jgi:hypothetical protein